MGLNIDKEVAAMERMTVNQLREKFAEVFGEETRGRNKQWLIKRIAWRLQANAEGGLSDRARRRAMELANVADLRLTAPRTSGKPRSDPKEATGQRGRFSNDDRLPLPGTLLTRAYKGRTLQVEVLCDGFEYEGEKYRSLSAVARMITGSHLNGFLFFGLNRRETAS